MARVLRWKQKNEEYKTQIDDFFFFNLKALKNISNKAFVGQKRHFVKQKTEQKNKNKKQKTVLPKNFK